MSEKFKNKYRIQSTRLQGWDYGSNAAYFITICTQNRIHFFGEIENQQMKLNEIGQLAEKFWYEIPIHFPFVELGNFVVMPNHTHGILIIQKSDNVNPVSNDKTSGLTAMPTAMPMVETRLIASLPLPQPQPSSQPQPPNQTEINGGFSGIKNPMLHQNIPRIIRWYKGRCTFEIRKINADFAWQSRYHDHIIRNNKSFQNISQYIINNPKQWTEDQFNSHKTD